MLIMADHLDARQNSQDAGAAKVWPMEMKTQTGNNNS